MKLNLNRCLQLAFLASSIVLWSCDHSPTSPDYGGRSVAREAFSFDIPAAGHSSLRLEGVSGLVTIVGSSQAGSVLITGERRVESSLPGDAELRLQDLEVRVDDLGSEIFVKTHQPSDSQNRNYVVDYQITLPGDFDLNITHISGNVDVRETHGNTFVNLISGRIQAQVALPLQGTVDMTSTSGGIDLRIPRSTSAEFSAGVVSGTINVSDLSLRNESHTPNSLRGTLGDGQGRISLNVISGTVRVEGY